MSFQPFVTPVMRQAIDLYDHDTHHLEDCPEPLLIDAATEFKRNGYTVEVATVQPENICLILAYDGEGDDMMIGGWNAKSGDLVNPSTFLQGETAKEIVQGLLEQRRNKVEELAILPYSTPTFITLFVLFVVLLAVAMERAMMSPQGFGFSVVGGIIAMVIGTGVISNFLSRGKLKKLLETDEEFASISKELALFPAPQAA